LLAVLSLRSHLQQWQSCAKYCKPVVEALLASLLDRFSGLLIRATPPQLRHTETTDRNFGSDIYVIAAVLDPAFRLKWLDVDILGSVMEKNDLRKEVIGQSVFF